MNLFNRNFWCIARARFNSKLTYFESTICPVSDDDTRRFVSDLNLPTEERLHKSDSRRRRRKKNQQQRQYVCTQIYLVLVCYQQKFCWAKIQIRIKAKSAAQWVCEKWIEWAFVLIESFLRSFCCCCVASHLIALHLVLSESLFLSWLLSLTHSPKN